MSYARQGTGLTVLQDSLAPERRGSGGSQWWSLAGWRWDVEGRMAAQSTPVHGLGLAGCPLATLLSTPISPLPTSSLPLDALQGQLQLHKLPRGSWPGTSQHQHSGSVAGFLCPSRLSCRRVSILTGKGILPTGPQCFYSPAP